MINKPRSIELVFDDWRKKGFGHSIYDTEKGIELSSGSFHTGTIFTGSISLDDEEYEQFKQALGRGYHPVFMLSRERKVVQNEQTQKEEE